MLILLSCYCVFKDNVLKKVSDKFNTYKIHIILSHNFIFIYIFLIYYKITSKQYNKNSLKRFDIRRVI